MLIICPDCGKNEATRQQACPVCAGRSWAPAGQVRPFHLAVRARREHDDRMLEQEHKRKGTPVPH
jgi:hypothetical protein